MTRAYYWLKIVWLSFKWVFRINLGDKVTLKTDTWPHTYYVVNGVCPGSWKIRSCDSEGRTIEAAPRKDCKKVWTVQICLHSFKFRYGFYMGYWFDIWCRNGIEPWMKKCNIW